MGQGFVSPVGTDLNINININMTVDSCSLQFDATIRNKLIYSFH